MRISVLLLGAAVALSVLTPFAPSCAATISPGELMYTDFYLWNGQAGYIDGRTGGPALTWRQILANFDCTETLTFYLWNAPTPPTPVVIPPTLTDSVVATVDPIMTPGGGAGVEPIVPVNPIGTPGGDSPSSVTAVPEPSTWAMLLLGFAGLGYAGIRRSKGAISVFD
jgi:PEP-CTERM motif